MLPALTFFFKLEMNQIAVDRLALGAHSKTTNEEVQGDMKLRKAEQNMV